MFATEKLVSVDEKKTTKDMLKNDVLMKLTQQVKKIMYERKDSKAINTVGIQHKEVVQTCEEYIQRALKEVLWMMAIEMGRARCRICTFF